MGAETAQMNRYDGPLKLSLAQWSYHKRYLPEGTYGGTGEGDPYDFPADAKALGFEGVEYVSQLYSADINMDSDEEHAESVNAIMKRLSDAADEADITEVLIMIDREGNLGDPDEEARQLAIRRHKNWIDAAAMSDIPTIRVNAGGEGTRPEVAARAVNSLSTLGAYAAPKNVNVVVENHGGYSSDPIWLRDVMAEVNMDNVGILPDFGNFCRVRGTNGCDDEVPRDSTYTAVEMWMPYVHAVSAKSHAFDAEGNETRIDYGRMLDIVRAHGYDGFVGVEFEGSEISEEEGIMATKKLLERS